MKHDKFIGHVQNLGRMSSRGEAELATKATLETLGECLQDGTARHIASQLPTGIGEHLESRQFDRDARDVFFDRICSREQLDKPVSVYHARAVVHTLTEAVDDGAIDHALQQLPPRFHNLFEVGVDGHLDWSDDGRGETPAA